MRGWRTPSCAAILLSAYASWISPPQASPPRPSGALPSPGSLVQLQARTIGTRLLTRLQMGVITLVNHDRDLMQFKAMAGAGCLCDEGGKSIAISMDLIRTLDRLSARATKQQPLSVLSLYRAKHDSRSREPHGDGLAVDIAAYGGHRIYSGTPREAVAGVLAIISALGPGKYRFGFPKPPATDPVALAPAPIRPQAWPFFPAPLPVALPVWTAGLPSIAVVLPVPDSRGFTLSSRVGIRPWVKRWANERAAPLTEVGSPEIRAAIRLAKLRGTDIHTLFPDALDHLHLDVAPPPGQKMGPALPLKCCTE